MNDSIVILGRQPRLGLAELESLYGDAVRPFGDQAAYITLPASAIDFKRLGGAIKLCQVITTVPADNWHKIQDTLVDIAPEHAEQVPSGKLHLGLSAYGMDVSPAQLTAVGLTIKKAVQRAGSHSVRLVPNREKTLNSGQVLHNKLTDPNGWELNLIRDGHRTIIAQTVSIQDIADYTVRDRGRPKRDARVGMLPPKLAQIIINLAVGQKPAGQQLTVLDPFCGTGVLLQEAILMGYKAYGTDIDARMVQYSEKNLEWLSQQYSLPASDTILAVGDATQYRWTPAPDVVACETYLGRPFTTQPDPAMLSRTATECNLIIKKFLQNIRPQLRAGTRLCLAVPAWQIRPHTFRQLPLIDHLPEMGYNQVSFQHVRGDELLYYRADQYVARRLLIITRK